ncbi:MAG TPA: ABC transporter permease [Puia sp.]|jgi:putative ABC transport system permease protein|nr:ABC transporter permease [Puia sp.]
MLRNYFTIAFRNLKKHRIFSLVNIVGLAVGLAVFWLMALYIADELSYDRWEENSSRIYRVVHSAEWPGGQFRMAPTSALFAPTLKKDYPEIEEAARIDPEGGGTLLYQDKKIQANDILFADNSFLTIFQPSFLQGDSRRALSTPHSIVLTRSLAEKLFGDVDNALGKTVAFRNDDQQQVTGVIEDIPANSHLGFSALRSMPDLSGSPWMAFDKYTYVLLRKDADPRQLEARFPAFFQRHLSPFMDKTRYRMWLQPLPSIHLHSSDLSYDIGRNNSDIRYIWLFSAIAVLILVIAVINYINLSTARSSIRVKEVGVRKVIGSGRRQLISLFLAESVLFTLIAAAISIGLAGVLIPFFNQLSGKSLTLWQFGKLPTLTVLFAFTLLTGLTGGIYPALFLSGFRTIPALKGQQGSQKTNALFRKSLVTFQFVITIVLIAGSITLYDQLRYMHNKDLGFNKQQVLTFHIDNPSVRERIADLKSRLLKSPLIESAGGAGNPIGNNDIGSNAFDFQRNDGSMSTEGRMVQTFYIDADYLHTLRIPLVTGRNFSPDIPTDLHNAVLVNETLADQMGWTRPLGKMVRVHTGTNDTTRNAFVIGVVKDFSIYSLQHKIEPLVLQLPPVPKEDDNCYVRLSKANIPAALRYIENTYREFDPAASFEYHFLDDNFERQYATEEHEGRLLLAFTALAIFIACLGLFGLVTFAVEQRTKEIGIRRVLGASVTGIVSLVSKDLIRPVVLAILIATPIAWYILHRWLEGYAYRVDITVGIFAGAGLLALLIAALTVSLRARRAARVPPAKSLRTE